MVDTLYTGSPSPFNEAEAAAFTDFFNDFSLGDAFTKMVSQPDGTGRLVEKVELIMKNRCHVEQRSGGKYCRKYGIYYDSFLGTIRDMSWSELYLALLRVVAYHGSDARTSEEGLRLVGLVQNDLD